MLQVQKTIRVVAFDDHPIARRGVRDLLASEADIDIVAEGADADTAMACLAEHEPDVALFDLFMPGRRTILNMLPEMRAEFPEIRIVILTMQPELAYMRRALAAGASGYVLKDGADEELVTAIRCAARGETYVNPRLAHRLDSPTTAARPGGLSPRELEILGLIAMGYTNAQIAEQLVLSVRTIDTHRAHIHQKLNISDRHELVAFALRHELIGRGRA